MLNSASVFRWVQSVPSSSHGRSAPRTATACPVWPSKAIATSKQLLGLDALTKDSVDSLPKPEQVLRLANHTSRTVMWGALDAAIDSGLDSLFGHLSPSYVIGGLLAGFVVGAPSIRHARKAVQVLRILSSK